VFRDRLVGVEVVDGTRLDVCESGRGLVKAVKTIMVGTIIEIRLKSGREVVSRTSSAQLGRSAGRICCTVSRRAL
jgi:hypothetical protein